MDREVGWTAIGGDAALSVATSDLRGRPSPWTESATRISAIGGLLVAGEVCGYPPMRASMSEIIDSGKAAGTTIEKLLPRPTVLSTATEPR